MKYKQFAVNIKKDLGIDLLNYKSTQMQRRITNFMERLSCKDFAELLQLLKVNREVKNQFIKHLTINVTEFFRNLALFAYLEKEIMPTIASKRTTFKIWSAGCSNGSEPYSLAIMMQEKFPGKRFVVEATDIDEEMLRIAKIGEYPIDSIKNLSKERLNKYFTINNEKVAVKPQLKSKVTFRKHNLMSDPYPENCDLIVCRNVLIYFTQEAQNYCYVNFSRALVLGGVFFIGTSENIFHHKNYSLQQIHPGFYRKAQK
jgi:chemotaxis protein methyltransferase CheR